MEKTVQRQAVEEYALDLFNSFYGIPLYYKSVKDCCFIALREMRKFSNDLQYLDEVEDEIKKL